MIWNAPFYDSVVQSLRLVADCLPEAFNIRYARFLSREQRNTVYALLLTLKRVEHGKSIPKSLVFRVAWLSFGGKLNPVFDARKGARTVIRACNYLTKNCVANLCVRQEMGFVCVGAFAEHLGLCSTFRKRPWQKIGTNLYQTINRLFDRVRFDHAEHSLPCLNHFDNKASH
jgi:hypothetical protein